MNVSHSVQNHILLSTEIRWHTERTSSVFVLAFDFYPITFFFTLPRPPISLTASFFLFCHLLSHLPTSLHGSIFALFSLSAWSSPKEPQSTMLPVFRSSCLQLPPSPFPVLLFLSHLQSFSRGSVAGLIAKVTVPPVPQRGSAILSSLKCSPKLHDPHVLLRLLPRRWGKTNSTLLMKLSVCQTTTPFPTPHCHMNNGKPHKHPHEAPAHKDTRTHKTWAHAQTNAHILAFIRTRYRGDIKRATGKFVTFFSFQLTCLYKPVIKSLTHTHTHSMNPYKRQGHVVPAYFLIHTSPLCGPWRTCTATRKNKPKQVQLRNLPWRFLF